MRIRAHLQGERGFWLGIGVGTLVVLALLFAWALPALEQAAEADRNLAIQLQQLQVMQRSTREIPSARTVADRADFRIWLDRQADLVDRFFASRAELLDAPIAGGDETPPEDFKEAYIQALVRQRLWFGKHGKEMAVANADKAFPRYGWISGGALPAPSEYRKIRRAYWARHYLYRRFLTGRAAAVSRLDVSGVREISPEFDGLRFRAHLLIAPERIKRLLDELLIVKPSVTTVPVFGLESLDISAVPSTGGARSLCGVQLAGYMLVRR